MPHCPGAAIGMPLVIELEGIGHFKSNLSGMEYGECLIVKSPTIPSLPVKLFQQNYFVVRYCHDGCAYGFRTTLLGMIKEPLRLFVLGYPERIESINLRKNERYQCLIPAALKIFQDDATPREWRGFIKDISAAGCCFEHVIDDDFKPVAVTVGDVVDFSICFSNDEAIWALHAKVRTMNIDREKGIYGLEYEPNPAIASQQMAMTAIQNHVEKLKH